jgi:hypothetical protein
MSDATKLCARCGINPRNSSHPCYCIECKRAKEREAAERRGVWKRPLEFCSKCGEKRTGGHPSYCTLCNRAYKAAQPCPKCGGPKAGPHANQSPYCVPCYREHRLQKTYGISVADFEAMLAAQGGVCDICACGPNGREWHVDHCHDSGRVRGVLCDNCNRGLGQFKESAMLLRRAADYLEG